MNKTISTRTGLITGLFNLLFLLVIQKLNVASNSPIVLMQFLWLFIGVLVSCFFLYKYYASITFIEAFTHCAKTVALMIVIAVIGNAVLYFLFSAKESKIEALTLIIMKTVFSYGLSGLLSAFFTSFIFHTFTKNQ